MQRDERSASHEPPHPAAGSERPEPADEVADDDSYCWVCGGPVVRRHCKIVCPRCGFTRDCSDP